MIEEDREQFSVCRFYDDGTNEYVCRWVRLDNALLAFRAECRTFLAQTGAVRRVIITDGLDLINAEWVYGKGIVFPPDPRTATMH